MRTRRAVALGVGLSVSLLIPGAAQGHGELGIRARITEYSENSGLVEGEIRIRNVSGYRASIGCQVKVSDGYQTYTDSVRARLRTRGVAYRDWAVYSRAAEFDGAQVFAWIGHCHFQ